MANRTKLREVATLVAACALALLGMASSAHGATSTSYSGTTSDGGSWVADVPSGGTGRSCSSVTALGRWRPPIRRRRLLSSRCWRSGTPWRVPRMTRPAPRGRWVSGCAIDSRRSPRCALTCPSRPNRSSRWGSRWAVWSARWRYQGSRGRIDGSLTACWGGRGRRGAEQLSARRRVRDPPAPRRKAGDQAGRLRQRGPRDENGKEARRDRRAGATHRQGPRAPGAGDGVPQCSRVGARQDDARCQRLPGAGATAVCGRVHGAGDDDGQHRVLAGLHRAGRRRKRVMDRRGQLREAAEQLTLCP